MHNITTQGQLVLIMKRTAAQRAHAHDEEEDFQDDSSILCDVTESQLITKGRNYYRLE